MVLMNMGLKNIEEYITDPKEGMPQQQQQDQGVAEMTVLIGPIGQDGRSQ